MHVKPVYDTIICFGDSLTQQAQSPGGFVTALQNAYQRRLEVIVRGHSGYTSRQGLALCEFLFESTHATEQTLSEPGKAVLATVWLGSNDCITQGNSQYIAEDEFRKNMTAIVGKHFNDTPVLLISPTTVVPGLFEGHLDDKRHAQYASILREVAKSVNEQRKQHEQANKGPSLPVIFIDMRQAFLDEVERQGGHADTLKSFFQQDGLHISDRGYDIVVATIMQCIEEHLPHLTPQNLPYVFPDWKSLDLSADLDGQRKQLKPSRNVDN